MSAGRQSLAGPEIPQWVAQLPALPVRFGWGWLHPWLSKRKVSSNKSSGPAGSIWMDQALFTVRLLSQSGHRGNYDLLMGFKIWKPRFSMIFRHLDQTGCVNMWMRNKCFKSLCMSHSCRWRYLGSKEAVSLCHGRCPAPRFPQICPLSPGTSAQLQAFCISKAHCTVRTGLEHIQGWDIHSIPGQIFLLEISREGHHSNCLSILRWIRKMQLSFTGD